MEKKNKRELIKIIVFVSVIIALLISIIFTNSISRGIERLSSTIFRNKINAKMVVHFIDVGQGDAVAIQTPNGEIVLVDCGPKSSQNVYIKYLRDNVFCDRKDKVINCLIVTHSDTDHIGAANAVLQEFDVKTVYRPDIATINEDKAQFSLQVDSFEYAEFISSAQNKPDTQLNTIKDEISFNIGEVKFEFFGPLQTYETTNMLSPYIKVSCYNYSLLLTGDAYGDAQKDIVSKYKSKLGTDIIKVAHHGSKNSLSEEFLQIVKPSYAVICVGDNSYGHPDSSTLVLLDNDKITTYRTDRDSNIKFIMDKSGIEVNKYNIVSQQKIYWWAIAIVISTCLTIQVIVLMYKKHKREKKDSDNLSGL